ncbi:MAG TPA: ABC transporter ATP-binding protein [Casimicrobiaceae bacterium]|nr:ABC transporter ATP-binding protein [Casimicrobiaceae bacterium]
MTAASIEFRNVTKRYGDVAAVRDLTFTIASGSLVTLLGPSGCGKTTSLRLIAGLELPDGGAILIGGRDVSRVSAAERDVSMVFQSYALFPHMSVLENVRYGLVVSGMAKGLADERARAALATVGLTGFDLRLPSELSGGQQQRVAVARALVLEPQVLLFDEPLSNLDARLRRQMREEIRELQQRLGLTVVYVTHDQSEAMAVSDRIIVMNGGGIAQEGSPRELYEQPRDPFVAGFMGDANRVRGTLTRRDATMADVKVAGLTLALAHRGLPDGDVDLSIRPEAIMLPEAADALLRGTVRKASYLGGLMEYTLATPLGDLFVISTGVDQPLSVGTTTGIAFARHGVVVIPPGPR